MGCSPRIHTHDAPVPHHTHSVAAGLDSRYQDGTLDVTVQIARFLPSAAPSGSYQIEACLYDDDADGPLVAKAAVAHSSSSSSSSSSSLEEVALSLPVKAPRKWTAETPELYTLVLALRAVGDEGEGEQVQAESCRVGFRYGVFVVKKKGGGGGRGACGVNPPSPLPACSACLPFLLVYPLSSGQSIPPPTTHARTNALTHAQHGGDQGRGAPGERRGRHFGRGEPARARPRDGQGRGRGLHGPGHPAAQAAQLQQRAQQPLPAPPPLVRALRRVRPLRCVSYVSSPSPVLGWAHVHTHHISIDSD